jgi:hypothetical protein
VSGSSDPELSFSVAELIENGRAEFPDFDAASEVVVRLAHGRPDFVEALAELPDGHRVVAKLANDPKAAARILGLPRVRMAAALGGYAARPAPAPVAKPVARPAPAPKAAAPAPMTSREYIEFRNRTAPRHLDVAHYLMSELGALAKKVPVTRLDVMKAVAAAVGARKISVIDGGNFTAGIPDQPDDLRSWLQNLYHVYIIWAVALNAHAHQMIGNPKGMIQ